MPDNWRLGEKVGTQCSLVVLGEFRHALFSFLSSPAAGIHAGRIVTTYVEPDLDDRGAVVNEGRPESVPAQYNEQSELVEEVEKGSQTIDFDLRTE
jgi:hypothetical protein